MLLMLPTGLVSSKVTVVNKVNDHSFCASTNRDLQQTKLCLSSRIVPLRLINGDIDEEYEIAAEYENCSSPPPIDSCSVVAFILN